MRLVFFALVVFPIIAWQLPCQAQGRDEANVSSSLAFEKCNYRKDYSRRITCANFTTPPSAGKFVLPVTIIHAKKNTKNKEAVLFIPGGPGQGMQTKERNISYWIEFLAGTDFPFDFVLFDPRGTGMSKPMWSCPKYNHTYIDLLSKNLSAKQELEITLPVLRACLQAYEDILNTQTKPSGPNKGLMLLSSIHQANDANALMEALAYESWHIWGESYGTRVALLAKSKKVKSLILDSPYPFDKGLFGHWIADLDRRFDIHRTIFSATNTLTSFHNFDILWQAANQRLAKKTITIILQTPLPNRKDKVKFVLNKQRLVGIAFFSLYSENLRFPFYEMLEYIALKDTDRASPGGEKSMEMLTRMFIESAFSTDFSPMTWYAVECQDNPGIIKKDFLALEKQFPHYRYLTEGMWENDICRDKLFATAKPINQELLEKKRSLILVGEFDPVTPPAWGRELAKQLGELATLHIARGVGHGVSASSDCDVALYTDFLLGKSVGPASYCEHP